MFKIDIETIATNRAKELTSFGFIGDEYYQLILKHLSDITNIAKRNIDENLNTGKDIYGNPVAPLKTTTILKKGHSKVFEETGKLLKSLSSKQIANDAYQVYISGNRSDIMYYLNYGTNTIVARNAFGLSNKASIEIEKYINSLINK